MNAIDLQVLTDLPGQPKLEQFQRWVDSALNELHTTGNIVIRVVDESESAELNSLYRGKSGATNILSFSFELPEGVDLGSENDDLTNFLGDLVICSPVVMHEASAQGKRLTDHWAHIVIHGILHLLGYDHIEEHEAEVMEAQEIAILKKLNINNPYCEVDS